MPFFLFFDEKFRFFANVFGSKSFCLSIHSLSKKWFSKVFHTKCQYCFFYI